MKIRSFLLPIVACAAFALSLAVSHAGDVNYDKLIGKWSVNGPLTVTEFKKTPDFAAIEKEDEKLMAVMMIGQLHGKIKVDLAADKVTLLANGRTGADQAAPATVKSSTETTIVLEITEENNEKSTLTISIINPNTIQLKSSTTADGDFFIWTRDPAAAVAPAAPAEAAPVAPAAPAEAAPVAPAPAE